MVVGKESDAPGHVMDAAGIGYKEPSEKQLDLDWYGWFCEWTE